ncbi:hypothetical protein [Flavobacterium sp.]|uniref:hypothetical protein n=1 Tax=Flavobacterium sp. TaxID=239 RepID=UPI0037C10515
MSKIFTDIPLGFLGIDNNSDEDCKVCSGTGQCQTCGGEGIVHVEIDDERTNLTDSETDEFKEDGEEFLEYSSSLENSYDYDDYSSSHNGDSNTKTNNNNYSFIWIIIILTLIVGYFGLKNLFKDLSDKSKPKPEIENIIDKVGYVNIKSEGRVQVYPTANMNSVESYYVYGREKVDVISFFPKYETYKIRNEYNQIGFIDNMFITFEDITKEYNGKVYREFYFENISLTENDRNEIKLFINELKEYSDDYEILSYDYLNQEAVAHHRGQDVFYLFDMSGIRNQFNVIVKFWDNDSKNTNNLIIIKSKEYNKELN